MITIPLYFILFIYGFFLLGFSVFFFINLGHLVRTGTFTFVSFFVSCAFIVFILLVLWTTWYLLQGVNWQEPITLWNGNWLGSFDSIPQF
ncbi:MAG TPA: hypothetical protein VJA27_00735 [Patescibacteria group bacterium]|nr:hypothetical protein [Patescibacteria group bacterium]